MGIIADFRLPQVLAMRRLNVHENSFWSERWKMYNKAICKCYGNMKPQLNKLVVLHIQTAYKLAVEKSVLSEIRIQPQ